jgi:hypothetical protein
MLAGEVGSMKRTRRHSNTNARRSIQKDQCMRDVQRIGRKLKIPTPRYCDICYNVIMPGSTIIFSSKGEKFHGSCFDDSEK